MKNEVIIYESGSERNGIKLPGSINVYLRLEGMN